MAIFHHDPVPIPGTNIVLTPFGYFVAGAGIVLGTFITVRYGPRIFTRVFFRRTTQFLSRWITRKFVQNLTVGPLPGTLLGPEATAFERFMAITNVGMWVTGMWNAFFEAGGHAVKELGSAALELLVQADEISGNRLIDSAPRTRVDDDGGPIVLMSTPSGSASVAVGAAWRIDP